MTYANNSIELFELTIFCKVWTANWGLIAVADRFSNCYLHKYIVKTNKHTMINKIITELYCKQIPNKIYNKLKRKLPYAEDIEDYQQEMYLILLETPKEKILDLHEQGKLADYFARICINQLVNIRSKLHIKLQTNLIKTDIEEYYDEGVRQFEIESSII